MKTLIASLTALTLGLGSLAAVAADRPAEPGTTMHKVHKKAHNKVHKASHKAHKKVSERHHSHRHA